MNNFVHKKPLKNTCQILHFGTLKKKHVHKPKFGLGSLWGSFKKMAYQIFDILIFCDFLDPEKCRVGKNRQKMAFFGLSEAKKSRKIKKSKIW